LLAEPIRLRLLALSAEEELAIGELAELVGEAQPNVSRHVAPLRRASLLAVRKQGRRALVRLADGVFDDPVIADALAAGRALCAADGSLGRVADVVRMRDAVSREFFDAPPLAGSVDALPSELPAYLSALAPLLGRRELAVDVGTGDGRLLDVLAPVFRRVVACDRSEAQLDRARQRLRRRGYDNVELVCAEWDAPALADRVLAIGGGADAVFASRVLHHAPRPGASLSVLGGLARPGGAVVVLDYGAHEDERLRDQQADLWLGFEEPELLRFAESAGLCEAQVSPIPAARCGDGLDGHLDWQVLVARRAPEPSAAPN
jgi:ArsR family transcriptional regulator